MSLKVIRSGTILQHTCHFLLVVHCDYIAISYRFRDISSTFTARDYPWHGSCYSFLLALLVSRFSPASIILWSKAH